MAKLHCDSTPHAWRVRVSVDDTALPERWVGHVPTRQLGVADIHLDYATGRYVVTVLGAGPAFGAGHLDSYATRSAAQSAIRRHIGKRA